MPREKPQFAPGTKVGVRFSGRVRPAVIVEDRGVFHDHRIVRVRLGEIEDPEVLEYEVRPDVLEYELRADELEPFPPLRDATGPFLGCSEGGWETASTRPRRKSRPNPCVRSPAMASKALMTWREDSAGKLDELIAAHASVGGTGRGRRYATQQINASLVVQVAAHFQLFCRDLHTDAARLLVAAAPAGYRPILDVVLTDRRRLDRGNASASTIGSDFALLGLDIWSHSASISSRIAVRRIRLEQLTVWRNAIAHQDFEFSPSQQTLLAGTALTLAWAKRWRHACDGLAGTFDRAVAAHVTTVAGVSPW